MHHTAHGTRGASHSMHPHSQAGDHSHKEISESDNMFNVVLTEHVQAICRPSRSP